MVRALVVSALLLATTGASAAPTKCIPIEQRSRVTRDASTLADAASNAGYSPPQYIYDLACHAYAESADNVEIALVDTIYTSQPTQLVGSMESDAAPPPLATGSMEAKYGLCRNMACAAGAFCAWGTKPKEFRGRVGVRVDGHLIAIEADRLDRSTRAPDITTPDLPVCTAHDETREFWFVSVLGAELGAGARIDAVKVDANEQLLRIGRPPRTADFATDAGLAWRPSWPTGELGPSFSISSLTRSALARDLQLSQAPSESVSRFSFGVRYEGAIFSQEWLHRIGVLVDYDFVSTRSWKLAGEATVGGGVGYQTSGDNRGALTVGLLTGVSTRVEYRVVWQVALALGLTGQGLFSNDKPMWITSVFFGPRVGY